VVLLTVILKGCEYHLYVGNQFTNRRMQITSVKTGPATKSMDVKTNRTSGNHCRLQKTELDVRKRVILHNYVSFIVYIPSMEAFNDIS